jgi:hypothetical protein
MTEIQLQHVPVAPPVKAAPAAPAIPAGTGQIWTNDGRVVWTNRFGMVFLEMPSRSLWIEMARVTQNQFNKVAGNDHQPNPEVSLERAEWFATSVTTALQKENEFPPGCETWRFAIPTSEEWLLAANAEARGLKMERAGFEWCLNVAGQQQDLFAGRYSEDTKRFVTGAPIDPQDVPAKGMALRLVLAPPGSPSR